MQFRWHLLRREFHSSKLLRNQQIIPKSLFDVSALKLFKQKKKNRMQKIKFSPLIMLVRRAQFFRSIAFYQRMSTQKSFQRVAITHAALTTQINLPRIHLARMPEMKRALFIRRECSSVFLMDMVASMSENLFIY